MAFYSVKNVYKNFGSNNVLKGIDFDLEKGQVLAIIGSSGSGKTTLLRCINFLEIPNKADIYLAEENIFSIDSRPTPNGNVSNNAANKDECIDNLQLNNSKESGIELVKSEDSLLGKKKKTTARDTVKLDAKTRGKIAAQRLKFGMVFQSFNLFPHYNVKKNLVLAARLKYDKSLSEKERIQRYIVGSDVRNKRKAAFEEINKRAETLLQRVGLGDKFKAYPCELSGGQQQRVAIARALILQPEILCFDEPTSALDPELTREVLKVIKDLKKDGHTMIIVTHEMEFARKVADKVIFMADGIIEEQGSPDEVFGNPQSEKTKAFLQESEKRIDED